MTDTSKNISRRFFSLTIFGLFCSSLLAGNVELLFAQKLPSSPNLWEGLYQPLPKITKPLEVSADYESLSEIQTRQFLADSFMASKLHRVSSRAQLNERFVQFQIKSKFGSHTPLGVRHTQNLIREIHAMHALLNMKESKSFVSAAEKAALAPFNFVKNLLEDPVDTITGIPKGVVRYMDRVGEMATGSRSEEEDAIAKELIGFSSAKRKLAFQLDIDVYSPNKALQQELNRVAWASYSGGFIIGEGLSSLTGGASNRNKESTQINEIIRDYPPEDLRSINRKRLLQMDMDEDIIKEFLRHPHYTPRQEIILVSALYSMPGTADRSVFIRESMKANNFSQAYLNQKRAQLLRQYSQDHSPINRIAVLNGRVVAQADNSRWVIPIAWDLLTWDKETAEMAKAIIQAIQESSNKEIDLMLGGKFTQRAKDGFEALGIKILPASEIYRQAE
ncbi:MAG: hypothetical protein G3M78_10265 [Candidatus Nitrohelix vancouverensis]|uniref:Uncharacterized protein n=1 Tax=Candidatus Nitrohelix vancouverensis TaxID=2705534 RepID=A0A7T0C3C9_9BACT|nr:MAG: hypothetical protein G3M78_10265 [Candidatus Nitrohelix vancouverensis]